MKCAPYAAAKTAKVIKNFEEEDGINTRFEVKQVVIATQRVLASVQEYDVGLDEEGKDRVVEEFQKKQSEMQEVVEQADGELKRAKLRIARRFDKIADDNGKQGDLQRRRREWRRSNSTLKH